MQGAWTIRCAAPVHAGKIAELIMTAMSAPCCLHLAGPGKTLADFYRVIYRLVLMDRSQYSYRNTLVALLANNTVAGVSVAYNGADLRVLREAFFRVAKEELGRVFPGLPDETGPGEYYIDSLAVYPTYRHMGIGSALLERTIQRAHGQNLPAGLLVDQANPGAERLYTSLGFEFVENSFWGGHPMKHLRCFPSGK